MTRLHELFHNHGQSPWLDNIRRDWLKSGELQAWIDRGIRGVTSNPSIFQAAIEGTAAYDTDLAAAKAAGASPDDAYWKLVVDDILAGLDLLRPIYDESDGLDGYVSVEVDPRLARDSAATTSAARDLHELIAHANLYVKIPATAEGLGPIQSMVAEGRSINVTLIFALERYEEVAEAYLSGLEAASGDLSQISSVASFFISRVDTEVDRRLDAIGTPEAAALRGTAAIANATVAYERYQSLFSGPRWSSLAARGARPQRVLWASTSTKNPRFNDTVYVDQLIGPGTVNTLPAETLDLFLDHGRVEAALPRASSWARARLDDLAAIGVDMEDVADTLEVAGVEAFAASHASVLDSIERRTASA